jgi:hypothetical protein
MSELRPFDDFPLTVLVPASLRRPIVMYDPQGALRLAVVEQDCAFALDESWDSAGVYVLLWPPVDDGDQLPKVYVGQASQGLRKRIGQHVVGKPGWRRAVLVDRANAKYGFNSAQVGWLEGRLWDLTSAAEHVQPTNKVQPKDDTLPDYDHPALEAVVAVIRRVMRLLGYSLDPPGTKPKATKKARFTVALKDLIAAGKLTAGDVLVFTDPAFSDTATISSVGGLEFRGMLHDSPSAAAAIVRGRPTNGWADWALVRENGTITLMKLREELTELVPPPEDKSGPA